MAVEFLYLGVVLDAWSRKIVGWARPANNLRAGLVIDALETAVGQRCGEVGSLLRQKPEWPASATSKAGTTRYASIPRWGIARPRHTRPRCKTP